MDTVDTQITRLNQKIDSLFQVTERLSHEVANAFTDIKENLQSPSHTEKYSSNKTQGNYNPHLMNDLLEHKDILIDTQCVESYEPDHDRVLSPELQIQRLTAQLTAAYHRIAALEEQLLSRRVLH